METVYGTEKDIELAAQIIRRGGLVVFPTETVYGLGGNALRADAAQAIYAAKGRPGDNPLIVHLADPAEAEKYCVTGPLFARLAAVFMPGPLTVIMPKRECIPGTVTGGLATVGVRVPSHPMARALIECAGVPIAAPSANLSGKPSPTSAAHVRDDLDGRVDMILDGGECEIGLESTIVRIDGEDALTLCRPGAVTYEQLCSVCGSVKIDKAVLEKLGEDETPVAPGMKYRHYAPEAPVTLIDGEHGAAVRYIESIAGAHTGVLCYDEDLVHFERAGKVISLGAMDDPAAQARALFGALREADADGRVSEIYAFLPERQGLGFAVYNRLIKAAGFQVMKLK